MVLRTEPLPGLYAMSRVGIVYDYLPGMEFGRVGRVNIVGYNDNVFI